jgi:putative ABC transport system ATP-binding protein
VARSGEEPLLSVRDWDVAVLGDEGPRILLRGLSFDLQAGEIVALVGPSGTGKTTLLRSLAGLIDPAGGSIALSGQEPAAIGWPAYRRRVSYLAQRSVVSDDSVELNLAQPFTFVSAAGRKFESERADEMLVRLGLHGALARPARKLSEGEKQRVCLVRTLLVGPDVLLLDEPTSSLDPDATERVETLLRDAAKAGAALLIVTHQRQQVERLSSRSIDLELLTAAGRRG